MKPAERKLLGLFRGLSEENRATWLAFGEFLANRGEPTPKVVPEPTYIERNPAETVIGALKRLSAMYPMLDKSKMLNDTSTLVTQHVVQGRERSVVIDELELVFKKHYELMRHA